MTTCRRRIYDTVAGGEAVERDGRRTPFPTKTSNANPHQLPRSIPLGYGQSALVLSPSTSRDASGAALRHASRPRPATAQQCDNEDSKAGIIRRKC